MRIPFLHLRLSLAASVLLVLSVPFSSLPAAPAAPTNLTATNLKATSFTLRWSASTGATGGIAGYDIVRDGVSLGSTTTRAFAVTGLAPLTSYSLSVIARDNAGYASPASDILAVTTPADTTKPTRPSALTAADVTTTSFTLNWIGSSDNVGVTGYTVFRASAPVGSTAATTFTVTGLAPDRSHRMSVRAVDAAGNTSAASPALVVHTPANPPSIPADLSATNLKATAFTLKWAASTGGTGGIVGYDVYRDGTLIGSTARRSMAIIGLAPLTTYHLTVAARDTVNHVSEPSASFAVTTPADTTRPTAPSHLGATGVASDSFTLVWAASTDNVGVTGYDVYKNGALFGTSAATALSVSPLAPSSAYLMKLRARDAAGNISAFSPALSITTSPITNAPPAVSLLAPPEGATFTLPIVIPLVASATDPDGIIAKVEFHDGTAKLGETTGPDPSSANYTLPYGFNSPGWHKLSARAVDNRGASTVSTPVQIRLLAGLPYLADFEAMEGYQPGPLDQQLGWTAVGLARITAGDAAYGAQSLVLAGGAEVGVAGQDFGAQAAGPAVAFLDLAIKPVADVDPLNSTTLDLGNARLACLLDPVVDGEATPTGRFAAWVDDGAGGSAWVALPAAFSLGAANASLEWLRVSLRVDSSARTWDVSLNGRLIAADLRFPEGSSDLPTGIYLRGHRDADTNVDDIYVGTENPVFADVDQDGMDDAWESGHGLNAAINDRNFDLDGDGLTNIQEFLLATNPAATDSDNDGLADSEELARGIDPANADSDRDGLPDGWELNRGFDPRSDSDAEMDADGDGLSTLQEFIAGSEPLDYYNGILPRIVSLVAADGSLGTDDSLSVRITDESGRPLANAPVSFSVRIGGHILAAALGDISGDAVTVITDANGIAKVFLKSGPGSGGPAP